LFLKVLQTGSVKRDDKGAVIDAHSTVTLIQTDQFRIIVDTGFAGDMENITASLNKCRIDPNQIDLIVNTHGHKDHTGNNRFFKNADILIHQNELQEINQKRLLPSECKVHCISSPLKIDANVSLIETFGHTSGCISVLIKGIGSQFNSPDETVVIAGDAIPLKNNFVKKIPPAIRSDKSASIASLRKISLIADWIIPGHDCVFQTKRA
jgi:glyoxylase-like metal-dependent hydrolase (beta-lactamase superfamily II)